MCEYCETTRTICYANFEGYEARVTMNLNLNEIDCEIVRFHDGELYGAATNKALNINYCPVCGRELNPIEDVPSPICTPPEPNQDIEYQYLKWADIKRLKSGTRLIATSKLTEQIMDFVFTNYHRDKIKETVLYNRYVDGYLTTMSAGDDKIDVCFKFDDFVFEEAGKVEIRDEVILNKANITNEEGEVIKEYNFILDTDYFIELYNKYLVGTDYDLNSVEEFLDNYDPEIQGTIIYALAKAEGKIKHEDFHEPNWDGIY